MNTKMIKHTFIASFVGCAIGTTLTSCDDLFEPALDNNHDITEMYSDPTFARGIMDNAYVLLPYQESSVSDVATDDAVSNDNDNSYRKMATGSWSSSNNPVSQWDGRYHAIQYLNIFLENADKVQWDYSSVALNEMHKDNYKGNAYALRAIQLFYLLRAHCGLVDGTLVGVPIHTSSEDGGSDFNRPRDGFKECIDQIMADLDEALKYLPKQYGEVKEDNIPAKYKDLKGTEDDYSRAFGKLQRGKIDGRMIAAIKAQVALFAASPAYQSANAMSWEDAAKYAAASLDNVGGIAGMDPNGWVWFNDVAMIEGFKFDNPDPAEICWRGNVGDAASLEEDNYPPSLQGKGRINPTQNLVDAFPMANGYPITDAASGYDPADPYANRDPRLKAYIVVNGDAIGAENKIINTAADNTETTDGLNREDGLSTRTGFYVRKLLRNDLNLSLSNHAKRHFGARIRYTEIFLDYAEAANEAQGPTANVGGATYSAYDVIKALHNRAGVGNDYLESIKNDKDKMRELIRNERRLELCFENHRFWDLRRWQEPLDITAKGVSITTDKTTGALVHSYIDVEDRKYDNTYMDYCPIPNGELRKWTNLRQNDGWK
ncbi:MAG: RagB/SusD family nutrient uptake outer membrane protein [Prevotella sp.]|nr:RagB/SusD family nutrient uptake outer membrane protein [Prevotella sp.]